MARGALKLISIVGLTILLGILSGLIASFLHFSIESLYTHISVLSRHLGVLKYTLLLRNIMIIGIVILCASVSFLLITYIAPTASGSGIQEIEGALLGKRILNWQRVIPVKIISGILTLGSGFLLGREGPTIQIGGHLGEMIGKFFKLNRLQRNMLIGAGVAAGISAAFNAPLAGIAFVLEELREHYKITYISFKTVAVGAIVAVIVLRAIYGQGPFVPVVVFTEPKLWYLSLFLILGLALGFISIIFNQLLLSALDVAGLLTKRQRLVFVILVAILIGFVIVNFHSLSGSGYRQLHHFFDTHKVMPVLLLFAILRLTITILCYATGLPGGIFSPLLAIGALFGGSFGLYLAQFFPESANLSGLFSIVGMGALFAGVTRAPFTAIILVVELTQEYALILPLMVACMVSAFVTQVFGYAPIYESLLKRSLKE